MNLVDGLLATARRLPDKAALATAAEDVTYAQLAARVAVAAPALAGAGLRPGDRVALLLGNSPRFAEVLYGALLADAVAVPLNPTLTPAELEPILRDAGARAVVAVPELGAALVALRGTLPDLDVVWVDGEPPPGAVSWTAATAGEVDIPSAAPDGAPRPGLPDGVPPDLALLQYTSGTTGEPKGAMLTHGQLAANQRQMQGTRLRVGERDVVFTVLPLFHIYALNVALGLAVTMGATLLMAERFDPAEALRADRGAAGQRGGRRAADVRRVGTGCRTSTTSISAACASRCPGLRRCRRRCWRARATSSGWTSGRATG